MMRNAVMFAVLGATCSVLGGAAGALLVWQNLSHRLTSEVRDRQTKVNNLVLVRDNGSVAAELKSAGDRTALTFFTKEGEPGLELGLRQDLGTRYIHFLKGNGKVVSTISSSPPDGQTTIMLGESEWGAHVIIGALQSGDIPRVASTKEWGIQLLPAPSHMPMVSAVVRSGTSNATASIVLQKQDGSYWTIQ